MKKLIPLLSLLVLFTLTGCSQSSSPSVSESVSEHESEVVAEPAVVEVSDEGYTTFNGGQLNVALANFTQDELSDTEKAGLLYMREEERLAHDLYAAFFTQWGSNIFNNIASSEQTHTDAVKTLLDRYSLEDPVQTEAGVFTVPELQTLYNDLLVQGSESVTEALKVGAIVEEVDILDLQKYLEDVDNEDIRIVYENLMRGSRNHLRAYVRNLGRYDMSYSPGYLSQEAYDGIIGSDTERGNGGFGNGNGGGRGGR